MLDPDLKKSTRRPYPMILKSHFDDGARKECRFPSFHSTAAHEPAGTNSAGKSRPEMTLVILLKTYRAEAVHRYTSDF